MKKEDFVQLVTGATFLGEERQKMLIDNAAWMTAKEREVLSKRIAESGAAIEKNNQEAMEQLTVIETAVKDFKKKELPKLVKAKEKEERAGEEKTVEKLLQDL